MVRGPGGANDRGPHEVDPALVHADADGTGEVLLEDLPLLHDLLLDRGDGGGGGGLGGLHLGLAIEPEVIGLLPRHDDVEAREGVHLPLDLGAGGGDDAGGAVDILGAHDSAVRLHSSLAVKLSGERQMS